MDLKSIVRAFRYGQLQAKSETDPNARRPPTIKFLGVALALLVVAGVAGLASWGAGNLDARDTGGPLDVQGSTEGFNSQGNSTAPPTTDSSSSALFAGKG